jgi:citryl-CoA lyase
MTERWRWTSGITDAQEDKTLLRGYELSGLIGSLTFSQAIYLLLKGELPEEKHAKMLDAVLVSAIDHGQATPSAANARIAASCGAPLNAAVASGILCISEHHGGAIEQAARTFQEGAGKAAAAIVKDAAERKLRLPGYGHKVYTEDPRAMKLVALARQLGIAGKHVDLAQAVEKELEREKGRKLCLNIDGAIAAIISDMGFDWRLGKAFFIIARTAGLCAHVHEEQSREKPYRRIPQEDCAYDGPAERKLKR